jgi:hypothetical protein
MAHLVFFGTPAGSGPDARGSGSGGPSHAHDLQHPIRCGGRRPQLVGEPPRPGRGPHRPGSTRRARVAGGPGLPARRPGGCPFDVPEARPASGWGPGGGILRALCPGASRSGQGLGRILALTHAGFGRVGGLGRGPASDGRLGEPGGDRRRNPRQGLRDPLRPSWGAGPSGERPPDRAACGGRSPHHRHGRPECRRPVRAPRSLPRHGLPVRFPHGPSRK